MNQKVTYRKGMRLKAKLSGKIIILKRRASGNRHWNCNCGRTNHRIHEGTLAKYFEVIQ